MPIFDPKPAEQPTVVDYHDALQKGLGRAFLWAEQGKLADKAILLEACLHDLRYDGQCEEPRGDWLWKILGVAGAIADLREPILHALHHVEDGLAAQQLCQLAMRYARDGDERFRLRLRAIVAEKPANDCPWLGEKELIATEREVGFLFAAQVRGESLQNRAWDWDDQALVERAAEELGKGAVTSLIDQEAGKSLAIDRFRTKWRESLATMPSEASQGHADRMRQYTVQDVIARVEGGTNMGGMLRGWGMYAEPHDLRTILERMLACKETAMVANYLRVFSNRALPEFDGRIMTLLDHPDAVVRNRAFTAVAQNADTAVRQFAITHLAQRIREENFLKLFIKNFGLGDERLLFANFALPDSPEDRHSILMDAIKILERNPAAECGSLALTAYFSTPCGSCRHDVVKLLVTRTSAPRWLLEECRSDAVTDTRKLAG